MINFTRAFDSAWERMHVILFRSCNIEKWLAIGFSAFLAGFLQGGNGVNGINNAFNNFNKTGNTQMPSFDLHQFDSGITSMFSGLQIGLVIFIGVMVFAVMIAFILVIYWLGARGQFMFLDNVVRNRGAIAWPWHYYARQANNLFWFYLLILLVSLIVILPIIAVAVAMCVPLYLHHRWPVGWEIGGFIVLGFLYVVVVVVLGFIISIFRDFGVPLMFRNGLMAREAFMKSLDLIQLHFGTIFIFVLLRFALSLGLAVLSIIVCCMTCCIALIPYVGTVILLPALVYLRCFSLDCLAQFGPEYDVWTVDVPPAANPLPPPG